MRGIFAASMSIFKDDLTLDIEKTLEHAKSNLDNNGVGSAFFGSTGCGQLVSVSEKKALIKELGKKNFKEQILIGTSSNSLRETINIMEYSLNKGFKNFLVMNVAYYKNFDPGVYNFYYNIIKAVPDAKIILYNFSKLSGYSFTAEITKKLANDFPKNIIGMKDSSGLLWNTLKIKDFSMFVGSEKKLLEGLKIGCAGCISATTNVTGSLAKQVYNDFQNNINSNLNDKLIALRAVFDETENLIGALHSFKSLENKCYNNLLPPLELLNKKKQKEMMEKLKELNFTPNKNIAA